MNTVQKTDQEQALQEIDGLTQLQIRAKEELRIGLMKLLDIEFVEAQKGVAVFSAIPSERFYNPNGVSHGGYAATLLDSACGASVFSSLPEHQVCTTIELKISYHRPILCEAGLIRAQGRVLSIGNRVAFAAAEITDADGKLYASATSSLMIIDKNIKSRTE